MLEVVVGDVEPEARSRSPPAAALVADVAELRHLAQHLVAARSAPRAGLRIGLYSEGAWGSPASSAACGRSSFQTGFEK